MKRIVLTVLAMLLMAGCAWGFDFVAFEKDLDVMIEEADQRVSERLGIDEYLVAMNDLNAWVDSTDPALGEWPHDDIMPKPKLWSDDISSGSITMPALTYADLADILKRCLERQTDEESLIILKEIRENRLHEAQDDLGRVEKQLQLRRDIERALEVLEGVSK